MPTKGQMMNTGKGYSAADVRIAARLLTASTGAGGVLDASGAQHHAARMAALLRLLERCAGNSGRADMWQWSDAARDAATLVRDLTAYCALPERAHEGGTWLLFPTGRTSIARACERWDSVSGFGQFVAWFDQCDALHGVAQNAPEVAQAD
jgi:hypothetical protein